MATILTVGNDGGTYDYSSIINALNAIPKTMVDDVEIQVNENTGGSREWSEKITTTVITTGDYRLTFRGMLGNIRTPDSQIRLVNPGDRIMSPDVFANNQFGLSIINFEFDNCVIGINIVNCLNPSINNCRFLACNSGVREVRRNAVLRSCVFDMPETATAIYNYGPLVKIVDSIIKAGRPIDGFDRSIYELFNSTLYRTNPTGWIRAVQAISMFNSIYVSVGDLIEADPSSFAKAYMRLITGFDTSIIWSELGADYMNAGCTFTEWMTYIGMDSGADTIQNIDPLLNKTGDIFEWMTPTGLSKALPVNQTLIENGIYASKNRTPAFIGAYTDYQNPDFPNVGNVLTRDTVDNVTGTYVPADEAKYLDGEQYGTDGTEFTGTLELGIIPNAPTITAIEPSDGTLTIDTTAADEALKTFALYKHTNKSAAWSAENATFSRTGSGTIAITGLQNGIEYDVITYHKDAAETVNGRPSNIVSGYPDDDAQGQYRHDRKIYERDYLAKALLQVAKNHGERIVYRNEGYGTTGVTVYGVVAGEVTRNVGIRSGSMDLQFIEVSIPRQTNFPPDNFDLNATIEIDGEHYQVQDYSCNPNTKTYAAEYVLSCASIRGQEAI